MLLVLFGCHNLDNATKISYKIINSEYEFTIIEMFDDFGYALDRDNNVLYTEDNGVNFQVIELNYPDYINIDNCSVTACFYSKDDFYVVCGEYNKSTLYVCKANTEGIEEITEIYVPYGAQQGNLYMLNDKEGYLMYSCNMGASSYYTCLYYTSDGCKNFSLYEVCHGISSKINNFSILENNEAYISTDNFQNVDVYKFNIIQSDNIYIKELEMGIDTEYRHYEGTLPVYVDNDLLIGYVILYENNTSFFKQKIYKTEDGGKNWERIGSIADKKEEEGWSYVYLNQSSDGEWWFINYAGDLCIMSMEE